VGFEIFFKGGFLAAFVFLVGFFAGFFEAFFAMKKLQSQGIKLLLSGNMTPEPESEEVSREPAGSRRKQK
jgi:hypothetical protein